MKPTFTFPREKSKMKRLIGTICLIAATTMAVGGDESQAHNRGRRVKSTGIRRGSVNRGSEARQARAGVAPRRREGCLERAVQCKSRATLVTDHASLHIQANTHTKND